MSDSPGNSAGPIGAGSVINDRYEVISLLGRGGMSAVYRVRDRNLDGQEVALKLLKSSLTKQSNVRERFKREAIISRKLDHPNIVRVFDFDTAPTGEYFIIMELVEGRSLSSLIHSSKPRMPHDELKRIFCEILQALDCAHAKEVFHRDLKPANVIVSSTGRVKVMDFGLARANCFQSSLSATGEFIGTPSYTSPEQIRGGEIDGRSDLYTFGILVYEALTGALPFTDESWHLVATKHLYEPFPALPDATPEWCSALVERCTAKDPGERFASASDARAFIQAA